MKQNSADASVPVKKKYQSPEVSVTILEMKQDIIVDIFQVVKAPSEDLAIQLETDIDQEKYLSVKEQ